jgi:glycosyltransferase involved in cell wall biosynthesis
VNEAVSIVMATYRTNPALEWFADGLANQLGDEDVELIVVDGQFSEERGDRFTQIVAGRFPLRHVPAKPSPYNGSHRLTRSEYFAASSARNTGLVYATKPYVVLVDDSAVPMPGWWSEVVQGCRHGYLVSGAFQRHWSMRVEKGALVSSRMLPAGQDSRWDLGDEDLVMPIEGGQVYTPSFAAPRQALVDIGGFDELCDTIGGEDYQLGIRLEHAGHRLFYSRRMLTIESEEQERAGPSYWRIDPTLSESRYMERLREFGVTKRAFEARHDASHMILDVLYGRTQRRSIGNYYELGRLGTGDLESLVERFPTRHWFTGEELTAMTSPREGRLRPCAP